MHRLMAWFESRLPLGRFWKKNFTHYHVPKNLNLLYLFGSLALLVLVNQFVTGTWLTMFYLPSDKEAFNSIEYIMRDVNYGWLLRYMHSTGASAFFIVIYLHMFRALLYGSYQKPRELVWLLGMGLFVLLLAEAFFGYLLPWGQMSYWGAQVITSLFMAIPYVGENLVIWLRGDYMISGVTLQRFFALHVIAFPLLLLFLIYLHIVALRQVGSNNPEGIDIKKCVDINGVPKDGLAFHPYFTLKDAVGALVFLIIFFGIVFYAPEMGGYFLEHDNFTPADPLVTPDHIAPVWYMTPFYAMLRAVPNKLAGISVMFLAIIVPFLLPWFDRSSVRSMRYKGRLSKFSLVLLSCAFLLLGYLGTIDITPVRLWAARVATVIYFMYFICMPLCSRFETTRSVPDRIS